MLELKVTTKVDPVSWDKDVQSLRGLCFHLYAWSCYSSKKYQQPSIYFMLMDDGLPCGLGFGRFQVSKLAGVPIIKKLSFSSLPVCRDLQLLAEMLTKIVVYCRENGVAVLEIGSFGTPDGTELLAELGFDMKQRWEFLLNIDRPQDELWMELNPKKRNKIKKGYKAEWKIIRAVSLEHIEQFRSLALETQKRKQEQGIPFPVADAEEYSLLKNMVLDAGLGRLYLSLNTANQPVAAAFFVGSQESATAYYMLSSSNSEGLRGAAPDLLLWTAITDFQKDGYHLFNFGGVSESELDGQPLEKSGLYTFKKTYSPEVHPCAKGTLLLRPAQNMIYNCLMRVKGGLG